jgi:hypothetical protein
MNRSTNFPPVVAATTTTDARQLQVTSGRRKGINIIKSTDSSRKCNAGRIRTQS